MSRKVMGLLLEIARCPNVTKCKNVSGHNCKQVVTEMRREAPLIPEPWSGKLEDATLLFLSSNPSINHAEWYPDELSSDIDIRDFFQERFEHWVEDGLRPLLKDGTFGRKVGYWDFARECAADLLRKDITRVAPGKDFVLSEVVHCKSKNQTGVGKALKECRDRYLRRLLCVSHAKIIVCVGAPARNAIRIVFDEIDAVREGSIHGPVLNGQRRRYFAFIRHPNAWGKRESLEKCLSRRKLQRLQEFLDATSRI